jgi:hypothetical protein
LNGTPLAYEDLPSRALKMFQIVNSTAPNRATNLLGMAQAYTALKNTTEAVKIYGLLLSQMNISNTNDSIFLTELNNLINQIPPQNTLAIHNNGFLLMLLMILFLYAS